VIAKVHQKNRPYWRKDNAKALIQPHHPPLNILGGYKFPNAPDVKLQEEKKSRFSLTAFPELGRELINALGRTTY
jgi:hypothetical protein